MLLSIAILGIISPVTSITLPVLNIEATERQTDYVKLRWNLTDPNATIETYSVVAEDASPSSSYRVTYEGPDVINLRSRTAVVGLHEADKAYNVCLDAWLNDRARDATNITVVSTCALISTIPTMLRSSWIALSATLGFFGFLIIMAMCAYKCQGCNTTKGEYKMAQGENGEATRVTVTPKGSIEA